MYLIYFFNLIYLIIYILYSCLRCFEQYLCNFHNDSQGLPCFQNPRNQICSLKFVAWLAFLIFLLLAKLQEYTHREEFSTQSLSPAFCIFVLSDDHHGTDGWQLLPHDVSQGTKFEGIRRLRSSHIGTGKKSLWQVYGRSISCLDLFGGQ